MLTTEELHALHTRLLSYRNARELPSEQVLTDLLDRCLTVYEHEDASYRPAADDGKGGGLLDFCGKKTLPVVLVPDLHARPDFLLHLLACALKKQQVLNALNEGKLIVVCVGDGVHTERPVPDYERWSQSYASWQRGQIDCPSMREEVRLGLATMMTVMELKCAFPAHFHFLKGNHENVLNREGWGDHSFRKVAMEGEMVRDFMKEVYGDAVLHLLHCFETSLPIVAAFDRFCVSHAEPAYEFSRDEIINYHDETLCEEVILSFTWTPNGGAVEGSVAKNFAALTGGQEADALWFGGHRPVEGSYALRQGGHYVQIHNPNKMNIVYISADRPFDLTKDIIPLERDTGHL